MTARISKPRDSDTEAVAMPGGRRPSGQGDVAGTDGRMSESRSAPRVGAHGGVTPDRLSTITPARISPIETSFTADTDSPSSHMPTTAVPAAPSPVHTAYAAPPLVSSALR